MLTSNTLTLIYLNLAKQMNNRFTVYLYNIRIYERQVGYRWCYQNDFWRRDFPGRRLQGISIGELLTIIRSIALLTQPCSIDDLRATYPTWTSVFPAATPVSPRCLVFHHLTRNRKNEAQKSLRYFGWFTCSKRNEFGSIKLAFALRRCSTGYSQLPIIFVRLHRTLC